MALMGSYLVSISKLVRHTWYSALPGTLHSFCSRVSARGWKGQGKWQWAEDSRQQTASGGQLAVGSGQQPAGSSGRPLGGAHGKF